MPSLLPDVLFPSPDLSLAELMAARLDGELVAVDGAFTPVDLPLTLELRLRAVAPLLGDRVILERQSALWAYGFRPVPPYPHLGCVRRGARRRVRDSARLRIREVVADDEDVVSLHGVQLTTRLRTAIDIARGTGTLGPTEMGQLYQLLTSAGVSAADCEEQLTRSRTASNRVLALDRLQRALR